MALIKCPECGRQVSDKAAACPDCGYPISSVDKGDRGSGEVAIKIGNIIPGRGMSISAARANLVVQVRANETLLGEGRIGTIIRFSIDKPTYVRITNKLLNLGQYYKGIINPNRRYELVCIPSLLLVRYALNEVDVIDSGY